MDKDYNLGYGRELEALHISGARYLVIGGIAMVLHRHPRTTDDLDIIPDLEQSNLDKIVRVLNNFGYKPKLPYVTLEDFKDAEKRKLWITEKNMKAFCLVNSDVPPGTIDIMVSSPLNFEEAYKRKKVEKLPNGSEVPLASLEDLLKLKLQAGRIKDLADIVVLEKFILRRKDD